MQILRTAGVVVSHYFVFICYDFFALNTKVVTVFPDWPPNEKEGAGSDSRNSNSVTEYKWWTHKQNRREADNIKIQSTEKAKWSI